MGEIHIIGTPQNREDALQRVQGCRRRLLGLFRLRARKPHR